jgi:phosphoribosylformimino-5-aminoimidazole carboxamide ribotide isomerase
MEIIPAIDLMGGRCVRLSKGDFETKRVYSQEPLAQARTFESFGFKRLHMVDLDGAREGSPKNLHVLRRICRETALEVDWGGGIYSDADAESAFQAGAALITAGSIAVKNPERVKGWLERWGSSRIILGADVHGDKIAVKGWAETADVSLFHFLEQWRRQGITQVISTDISRDGMLRGPALPLYKAMKDRFPGLKIIASGGVSHIRDLQALAEAGIPGAIVGKAIYEKRISLDELSRLNSG